MAGLQKRNNIQLRTQIKVLNRQVREMERIRTDIEDKFSDLNEMFLRIRETLCEKCREKMDSKS